MFEGLPVEITDSGLLLLLGSVVMIAVLAVAGVRHRQQRKHRQAQGLRWLATLRALLSHIQKHRGLCSGYLNGEPRLLAEIETQQRQVSRDLNDIASVDIDIEDNPRWQGITQHWARLAGNFQTLSVENCLKQHNQLIKNILYLIDDLAQASDLLLLKNKSQKPLHVYWRELLAAAEYIGQARAIGTGVSAAAYCDSVSRIRLSYLCQKIEENTERLAKEIGPVRSQTGTAVKKLITCINEQLLQEKPNIDAGAYFAIATEAIDSLLEQFDRLVQEQKWS